MATHVDTGQTMPNPAPDELASRWAPKLKALADENRLLIALLLTDGPHTVKELQEATGLSQALVSHHLKPLREQGLVAAVPQGRSNVYTLCCDELAVLIKGLAPLTAAPSRTDDQLCS